MSVHSITRRSVLAFAFVLLALAGPLFAAGPVHVILWFDTEDYILPASDDAALRLADLLSERGVRATFKVVGEKARALEQRGRRDVIAALARHDIAYHTDYHSVHPTPTEYLADAGLLDGIAEFTRRERAGAADVRRIFSVKKLSCYGQPGSAWAPQAIAALPAIGVEPCYLDEGSHVGLRGRPFWYAGALTVYNMRPNVTRMDLHDPNAFPDAAAKVTAIADRLRAEGGGLISIFYHPCEWVHAEFWDGINFPRGANPPRADWKIPPQLPAEKTNAAFRQFARYVDHIRALPDVRFVTASDLPSLYPDAARSQGLGEGDLLALAHAIADRSPNALDFQVLNNRIALSPADQFDLLASALHQLAETGSVRFPLRARNLLGPDAAPPAPADTATSVPWPAFLTALRDVHDFLNAHQRIPARVFIGPDACSPADFLTACASAYLQYRQTGRPPGQSGVRLGRDTQLLTTRQIAEDTPGLFGGWIIHRQGFRASRLMEIARLQAWTLKPALRAPVNGDPPAATTR